MIVGKVYRQWFTLFFIPIFPISGKTRMSECTRCKAVFRVPVEEFGQRVSAGSQAGYQQAIALYNSLRASPADSAMLQRLMEMYASMNEYTEAISAAKHFPEAMQNSQQCMTTQQPEQAIAVFDAALARNAALGEAHYYKAVAYLTMQAPALDKAAAAARQARGAGYVDADALMMEIDARAKKAG